MDSVQYRKAISIRQPWAWLIINAGKDIENRNWRTTYRGDAYIHASKGCTIKEYQNAIEFVESLSTGIIVPKLADLDRGGIVGYVNIIDCVSHSDSPWFFGKHGFVLSDAKALDFYPMKGRLGFFDVPESFLLQAA